MAQALDSLRRLETLKLEFGPAAADDKLRCLKTLKAARLKAADQVVRLHEALCFLQAWPDNAAVAALTEDMLAHFDRRRDVRQHADELADTGIAGTAINFSFYAATARWLAERWPDRLHIDWDAFENVDKLESFLSLLVSYSETPAVDNTSMELPEWIDRLKGADETDATFVIRRFVALVENGFLYERVFEDMDMPLVLDAGPDTPSRTRAKYGDPPIVAQTTPFPRQRPRVADEILVPTQPAQRVSRNQRNRLVDVAHTAMVTRQRDLDAFAYADPNDVRLIDDGDGVQFVLNGVLPERRFLLETQYGFVVLKNGVPIGYGAITCLFRSAEVAYTVFDSFRGGESARIYVRTLAMVYQVFGCDTFMIDPYQLGADNEDALKSGAWWFYQKLGYRPREKSLLRLMDQELSKMKKQPRHRSSMTVLKRLASENVYLDLNEQRDDVVGILDFANVGLKICDLLAERFGSDREEGGAVLSEEAASRLGVRDFRGWSAAEKVAWRRWSPLVALIGDVGRWPAADRESLVDLIRAKGGQQELSYLRQFDDHLRLRKAVVKLAAN